MGAKYLSLLTLVQGGLSGSKRAGLGSSESRERGMKKTTQRPSDGRLPPRLLVSSVWCGDLRLKNARQIVG